MFSFILRICAVAALVLGVLFWTGHATSLVGIHMLLGILVVLSAWVVGFSAAARRLVAQGVSCIVAGAALLWLGLNQTHLLLGPSHWIVQAAHLLLALLTLAAGEAAAGAYRRQRGGRGKRFAAV